MQFPDSCLIQFAKAPVLGQVKTRLQPAFNERQSLLLHQRLVKYQFDCHRNSSVAHYELWGSANHEFFHQLVAGTDVPLRFQSGNNLGERMSHAFTDRLQYYRRVVLIGSDCPAIDPHYIEAALAALSESTPAVYGPANDGGYVLVGLMRVDSALFNDIPWGGDQVMSLTRSRLKMLDWCWQELPPLTDIDRPEDLGTLSQLDNMEGIVSDFVLTD